MLWEARQCIRATILNLQGFCRGYSVGPHRKASSATTYSIWYVEIAICRVNGYGELASPSNIFRYFGTTSRIAVS